MNVQAWTFAIVGILAVFTLALVALFAPRDPPHPDASPLRELNALKSGQVWLTLGVGAVGFGGMFAVYAYLASTLTKRCFPELWSLRTKL